MKVRHRAVMQLMLDALIESRECLDKAHQKIRDEEPDERVLASLDRSNRVIHRAMITLRECDI